MSVLQAPPPRRTDSANHMVLRGIGWTAFEKILYALPSRRLRAAYAHGTLEIMSPLPIHEVYKVLFGRLMDVLFEELDIPGRCLGSTTYRRQDVDHGIEPDNSFYLKSAVLVTDWFGLDLTRDPPPDMAVEVDVTSSVLNRLGIYAALHVPEIWRSDTEIVEVLRLTEAGEYERIPTSVELPFMPMDELIPLFDRVMLLQNDSEVMRALRAWVRERVRPLYDAWRSSQSPPA